MNRIFYVSLLKLQSIIFMYNKFSFILHSKFSSTFAVKSNKSRQKILNKAQIVIRKGGCVAGLEISVFFAQVPSIEHSLIMTNYNIYFEAT